MPILSLKFKETAIGQYELQKGVSLTIGRRNSNDVVIENLAVSGHHAKIDSVGDSFVLIDLQSKNGSFVNEKIVNSHWLDDGDVINIGKHSLVFSYTNGEQLNHSGSDKIEKTMVMDTSQYRSMMKKSKTEPFLPPGGSNGGSITGGLAFLSGGSGKIKLSRNITKIGKHPKSDIVIKGMWVGKTAFTISKRPDGFYLSYVGGMAKPKINDQAVKQACMLSDLDIIEIGSTKLQFHDLNRHKTRLIKIDQQSPALTP
jgi:pSer/pThr/pTyr-binding forkhead associated (FHA) protein